MLTQNPKKRLIEPCFFSTKVCGASPVESFEGVALTGEAILRTHVRTDVRTYVRTYARTYVRDGIYGQN